MIEGVGLCFVVSAMVVPLRYDSFVPWTVPPSFLAGPPGLFDVLEKANGDGRTAVPCAPIDFGVWPRQGMMRQLRMVQDYEVLCARRFGVYLRAVAGMSPPSGTECTFFDGRVRLPGHLVRPTLLDPSRPARWSFRWTPRLQRGSRPTAG